MPLGHISFINLLVEKATWEDAAFIQKVFPVFHPCGQVCSSSGGIVRLVAVDNTWFTTISIQLPRQASTIDPPSNGAWSYLPLQARLTASAVDLCMDSYRWCNLTFKSYRALCQVAVPVAIFFYTTELLLNPPPACREGIDFLSGLSPRAAMFRLARNPSYSSQIGMKFLPNFLQDWAFFLCSCLNPWQS